MKKLLFITLGAVLLSACSTSNQISLTQSRYGNGIGISFGSDGLSKAEQAKAEHFKEVVSERIQQRKFLKAISLDNRAPATAELAFETPEPLVLTAKGDEVSEKNSTESNTETEVRNEKQEVNVAKPTSSKKGLRKNLKALKNNTTNNSGLSNDGVALLLLVIIALILPPLAVFLYEGVLNARFWLCLILTLLFFFPGMLYALILILGGY